LAPPVDRLRQLETEVSSLRAVVFNGPPSARLLSPSLSSYSNSGLDHFLSEYTPMVIDGIPETLFNLSLPVLPAEPSFRGQIFGIAEGEGATRTITHELYIHAACAPEMIDYINSHNPIDGDEPVIRLQYAFDVSKASVRLELCVRVG
jgi:hypothetical protein